MIGRSPFGVRLWRLLSRRRPTFETSIESMAATLTRMAAVSTSELDAMFEGAEPSPEIVRRLGPALGIHTADMFVIAGYPVPQDLASAWPTSPWDVGSIIEYAVRMDTPSAVVWTRWSGRSQATTPSGAPLLIMNGTGSTAEDSS